jgi:hypothetical protein
MARKKKKAAVRTTPAKKNAPDPRRPSKNPMLVLAIGAVLLVVGGLYLYRGGASAPQPSRQTVQTANARSGLQETRPTLPPSLFSGKVREAYAIARDIPEVLDQLYCYCRCRENFGHRNLLSCYVDNHAST